MGSSSMKVHQFTRAFWEQEQQLPSLTLGHCKRLRPLAPKLTTTTTTTTTTTPASISTAAFDLKSFIRPESGPRKLGSSIEEKRDPPKVETHPGGTRWNPTQEQIGILEMLYRNGMRTPNAQQIEQITAQLGKYGKIEGKNVFYWFQNHKARERQKQKRNSLGLSHSPRTATNTTTTIANITFSIARGDEETREEDSPYKRKCRSWGFEFCEEKMYTINEKQSSKDHEDGENITLELFPLHPEGR